MRRDRLELHAGQVIDRYELLIPASPSGTSHVWAARLQGTRGFGKLVGLKALAPAEPSNRELARMLPHAAQLASRLQHPNVAQCFDLLDHSGFPCLTMEWIDGEPLSGVLRGALRAGGVPLGVALQIAVQACEGLQAAHALCGPDGRPLGLVHGDVSPKNLMIDTCGTLKLLNFGIPKLRRGAGGRAVQGPPAFTAPEQTLNERVDLRADIFSLGVVLYLLTTGVHPFGLESIALTQSMTGSEVVLAPPSAIVDNYPARLERVLMRALARRPEERFQSAAELRDELVAAFPGYASEAELAQFLHAVCGSSLTSRRSRMNQALQRESLPSESNEPLAEAMPNTLSSVSLAYVPANAPREARRTSLPLALGAGVLAFVGAFCWEMVKAPSTLLPASRAAVAAPPFEPPVVELGGAAPLIPPPPVGTVPSAAPAGPAPAGNSTPANARAARRRAAQPTSDRYGI